MKIKSMSPKMSVASVLGVLGFLLSIVNLYWNWQEHNIKMEEYELSQVPIWQMDMSYDENNIDLLQIKFTAKNDGIILQGFDIYTPSDFVGEPPESIVGGEWRCYDFTQDINNTVQRYFSMPDVNLAEDGALAIEHCYPIAVKFRYIRGEKVNEYFQIYLAHIFYYTKEKVKIKRLELYKKFKSDKAEQIIKTLDELNESRGLVFDSNNLKREEGKNIALAKHKDISLLIGILTSAISINYTYDDKSNPTNNYKHSFTIPQIYYNNTITDSFKKQYAIVIRKLPEYDDILQNDLRKLDAFINKVPIDKNIYNNQRETIWLNEKIRLEYEKIVNELLADYNQVAFNR